MSSQAAPAPTIEDLTDRVDNALKDILADRSMGLYRMMAYHMGWDDAQGIGSAPGRRGRTHGVACLVVALAAGGRLDAAMPAATAVELVDGFAQVHDDVQGGQPQRHGRDAVWWIWGPAQAINVGDGLHALARLALFQLQERGLSPELTFEAVQMLDQAGLELCEGRFHDLEAQERIDLDVDGYLRMAAGKTGALYACAMAMGALTAGASNSVISAVSKCGRSLGVALQVQNDLQELSTDAPSPEVLNKKKLLPVVHALGKATISEKRKLGDIYFKRVLEPRDVAALLDVLDQMGSIRFCQDLAARYRAQALQTLYPALAPERLPVVKALVAELLD